MFLLTGVLSRVFSGTARLPLEIRRFSCGPGNDLWLRKCALVLGSNQGTPDGVQKGQLENADIQSRRRATPASGKAMAECYLSATLKADPAVAAAAYYYAGAETEQHSTATSQGATRHIAEDGTVALLRRDISPALAARLGIAAPARPLTQDQIANLLNAQRLDGNAIEARKKHSATRSVAEVFGLDPLDPPPAEAIRNVLAGKRADGGTPQSTSGNALPSAIIEGARKRFKAALDIPAHREATTRNSLIWRMVSSLLAVSSIWGIIAGKSMPCCRRSVCRSDVFGRQVALGRLGPGAD